MKTVFKHFSLLVVSLTVLSLLCGCDKCRVRRTLSGLMDATIVMPDSMSYIRDGSILPAPDINGKRLIVFVDSTECSKCRIEKFARYRDILECSQNTHAFRVMLLLSISKGNHDEIINHIILTEPDYDVFIDENNEFRRLNPSIPDDVRFHCLYIDEDGKVLLVGDPAENESINKLFMKMI